MELFSMQIYTNFESNSQQNRQYIAVNLSCFRCKFTQILKAIHNYCTMKYICIFVVFDANLHKF